MQTMDPKKRIYGNIEVHSTIKEFKEEKNEVLQNAIIK